ncbi:MAG: hypothetical protein GY801_30355 [bacterium]|nr:hypothetical protein [bacterium]
MKTLFDKFFEAYHSKENLKKHENNSRVKLYVGMGRSLLSDVVGFSIRDYFQDPAACLAAQLKWKLFLHNEINDDTPLDAFIGIDYVTALEASLFGQAAIFPKKSDPTYGQPVIVKYEDINNLPEIDFFSSGIMPEVHRMYQELGNLLEDGFQLFFPGWARGPWSIATIIRGFTELFLDTVDDPEFVHRLMNKIVDSRISFESQRCKFLQIDPTDREYQWKYCIYRLSTSSDQYEDEVDGNLFSSNTFKNFILPYSKKLSAYYGGISYYHSCGNLSPFLEQFPQLNITNRLHISPHTDIEKAMESLPKNVVLQISLHPIEDVMLADEEKMRLKLEKIITQTKNRNVEICPDALYEGGWNTVNQVKKLIKVFREVSTEQL